MSELSDNDGIKQCRVKITGTYKGKPFVYIDPEDSQGSQFISADNDPSTFWWTDGNYSCDCNRSRFVPLDMIEEEKVGRCGDEIYIDTVEPLDNRLPMLVLNESKGSKTVDNAINHEANG